MSFLDPNFDHLCSPPKTNPPLSSTFPQKTKNQYYQQYLVFHHPYHIRRATLYITFIVCKIYLPSPSTYSTILPAPFPMTAIARAHPWESILGCDTKPLKLNQACASDQGEWGCVLWLISAGCLLHAWVAPVYVTCSNTLTGIYILQHSPILPPHTNVRP